MCFPAAVAQYTPPVLRQTDIKPGPVRVVLCLPGGQACPFKLAAGETAFETRCLVYIHCYQEGGSKVGIYSVAA